MAKQRKAKESAEATVPAEAPKVDLAQMRPLDAPTYYCSSFFVGLGGSDAYIVGQRPRPLIGADGISRMGILEPVAMLQFSVGSLKDLSIVIDGLVRAYEKEFGEIETEFTRRRKKEAR